LTDAGVFEEQFGLILVFELELPVLPIDFVCRERVLCPDYSFGLFDAFLAEGLPCPTERPIVKTGYRQWNPDLPLFVLQADLLFRWETVLTLDQVFDQQQEWVENADYDDDAIDAGLH
jgi:hypothetical protein